MCLDIASTFRLILVALRGERSILETLTLQQEEVFHLKISVIALVLLIHFLKLVLPLSQTMRSWISPEVSNRVNVKKELNRIWA